MARDKSASGTYRPSATSSSTLIPAAAAAATVSPRHSRHSFTRSLSELSSPLRLRRHNQSQSQSQDKNKDKGHSQANAQNKLSIQGQAQSGQASQVRQNAAGRDSRDIPRDISRQTTRDTRDNRDTTREGDQDGRALSRQASVTSSVTTTNTGATGAASRPLSTASEALAAPPSPSQSPHLPPLVKSRTTGTMNTLETSGTSTSNEYSAPPSLRDPASSTASPSSSRRPSVRISKDYSEEQQMQQLQQLPTAAASHHHHHHHHHRPHIHRHSSHHNSHSTNTHGYIGSHSTTVAAFAAAATAVAAASPTGQALPNVLFTDAEDPERLEKSERKISATSAPDASASASASVPVPAPASNTKVPLSAIDSETVAAVAATLQKMQRRQSRQAALVLQAAVSDIDGLSSSTSDRLDTAYSSILNHIGKLQDTILALRKLAAAARKTNDQFSSEADLIAHEIDGQISVLEGKTETDKEGKEGKNTPDKQEARLKELSARVKAGRQSIESLSERVEKVRARVDAWERADKGWQERTRMRLQVLWVIILGVIVAGIAVYVVAMRNAGSGPASALLPEAVTDTMTDAALPSPPGLSALASPSASTGKFQLTFPNKTNSKTATDGELQHLFDEL